MNCEKILVHFDSKGCDYRSLKNFNLLSRYPNDVRKIGVIITFHPNSFELDFDCKKKCLKMVQIVL